MLLLLLHGVLSMEWGQLDLIDGTPILDIKPYLPWVDAVPAAATPSWIPDPGEVPGTADCHLAALQPCWPQDAAP